MTTVDATLERTVRTGLPVTPAQLGLLVAHARAADPSAYHTLYRLDLDPRYSAEAVARALSGAIALRPAMRQVFGLLPRPHARLVAPVADVVTLQVAVAAVDFADAVSSVARQVGQPAFDLGTEPAHRCAIVRAEEGTACTVLLAVHCLLLDAVSIGLFADDLAELLTAPPTAAELAMRVADREAAHVEHLEASPAPTARDRSAAWARRLRRVPSLELAPVPGRPARTSLTGGQVRCEVDAGACLGFPPRVLFTGLYAATLARHANTSEVVIGTELGRSADPLPVIVEVDWTLTVDAYLSTVVGPAVEAARAGADISLAQLTAETGRGPLHAAVLAVAAAEPHRAYAAVRAVRRLGNGTVRSDLWLGVTPQAGHWLVELEYDRELIAPAVADGLLASLRTAVRRAVDDRTRTLAELFTDASTAASVRSDGRHPRATAGLYEAVEAMARQQPTAVAVREPGRDLTYADLLATAGRMAGGLAARGVGPGDVVGLAVDSGLADSVAAIVAVLRRGATFLPLDATVPRRRLDDMVRSASCRLVIGAPVASAALAVPVAELATATTVASAADPDAPVYVMYTSGSAGAPKGVLMGQAWLAELAAWQIDALAMNGDSRFLQYAPLSSDVCFQEIVPTLLCGGTVLSLGSADRRDPLAVLRHVVDTGATHVYLPTAALRPMVQLIGDRGTYLPDLRYLCVSGEQLTVDEQEREFLRRHPHCTLVNHYGPTETQAVTTYRLRGDDPAWPAHVPIGVPLPGVAAYVVDATGHLAPPGVVGELHLGGRCLAAGYLNDPELTAARFVPDTFGPAGGLMYRTGDLVVRNDRDELVFLGRLDSQVKIQGQRVELGEIEVVAARVLGVRQAVAAVRGEQIALFLLPHPGAAPEPSRVREHLAATLPAHMRPQWIVPVTAVPTTTSGKTDRAALLRRLDELLATGGHGDAARPPVHLDALERGLAALWSRILGVGDIPHDHSVFDHGASSLTVLDALTAMHAAYGVTVPVADLYAAPTVAGIAAAIRAGAGTLR
ncbi:amino acid adenylation domain-containing protein [Dactylosporangium matsuzakiense]|nr:amino acid adenylation domain-containing protein [Dactylosporangium matsuzakiense]